MEADYAIDWIRLYRRARAHRLDCLVAATWPGSLTELARLLATDRQRAAQVGICYRPSPACPPEVWAGRVATGLGLDPRRVRRLAYIVA